MAWEVQLTGAEPRTVRLARSDGAASVWLDGRHHRCGLRTVGERFEVTVDDHTELVWMTTGHGTVHIHAFGRAWRVDVIDPAVDAVASVATDDVTVAPMPGMVIAVGVEAGQAVLAGQTLLVIESMKMQNEIIAGRNGTIERILVEVGDSFDRGAGLVALTPAESEA